MKDMVAAKGRVNDVRKALEALKPQIARALPKHVTADRMMRIVMTSVQRTPKLMECDQTSLFGSVLLAAQLGLEPDGVTGQGYLVPYGRIVQFIPGYRGLISLARRSGELSTIYAYVVHEKDEFTFRYGLDLALEHVPSLDDDPGNLTHVYAVAHLKDGGKQCEVMSKRQVDAIRKRSASSGSGPWVTDYEEMAKKTVLRRLCKMLPISVELQKAIHADDRAAAGEPQDVDDWTAEVVTDEQPPKGAVDRFIEGEKQKALPAGEDRDPGAEG